MIRGEASPSVNDVIAAQAPSIAVEPVYTLNDESAFIKKVNKYSGLCDDKKISSLNSNKSCERSMIKPKNKLGLVLLLC